MGYNEIITGLKKKQTTVLYSGFPISSIYILIYSPWHHELYSWKDFFPSLQILGFIHPEWTDVALWYKQVLLLELSSIMAISDLSQIIQR